MIDELLNLESPIDFYHRDASVDDMECLTKPRLSHRASGASVSLSYMSDDGFAGTSGGALLIPLSDEEIEDKYGDFCIAHLQQVYRHFTHNNRRYRKIRRSIIKKLAAALMLNKTSIHDDDDADAGSDLISDSKRREVLSQIEEFVVRSISECWAMVLHKPALVFSTHVFYMKRAKTGKPYKFKKGKYKASAGSDRKGHVEYCAWPAIRLSGGSGHQYGLPVVRVRKTPKK